MRYPPYNFGLTRRETNIILLKYLSVRVVSLLPMHTYHLEQLEPYIDWSILSTTELSHYTLVKYKDKIDWFIYFNNGHPKDLVTLILLKDKIIQYYSLFLSNMYNKKLYYTEDFINLFPAIVDWRWCLKNKKNLSPWLILKYWDQFTSHNISKYYNLSCEIIKEKKHEINWRIASKRKLSECCIRLALDVVYWKYIWKYQKLSEEFIKEFT